MSRTANNAKVIPAFVASFFKDARGHIASLYDDNVRDDPEFGYTYRLYASNVHVQRESFRKDLEKVLAWAKRCGADGKILSAHFPHYWALCRRGDYLVFTLTSPVAESLEAKFLLPEQQKLA